jgi:ribosomal protein L6P/L9E
MVIPNFINNMIVGVSEQFQLTLILKGVGYRVQFKAKKSF